jgi:serine/threonine-protein kinase
MACLDENELTALLEHQLNEAELARIDDHVATCAACRQLVSALKRPGTTALAFADTEAAVERADLSPLTNALAWTNAERRVGNTVGEKWTLNTVLGVGGMAQVFGATHRNGKRVAIKLLRPELCADPAIRKRFLQEGYAANKVGHPGAVSVLDDGIADDGSAFLVMELLDGETLGQRLDHEGPLPASEVRRIASAILEVLGAAHAKGMVHRDIKPENVFVEKTGSVRLLDFGIARVLELTRERGGTEAGAILGTPSFMPPEQARGRWDEVDARSDLWAVGATMYMLLTGAPVRSETTRNEELLAAMTAPVPPIRKRLPALDASLAQVVDTALALDRGARFASADEMRAALAAKVPHPPLRRWPGSQRSLGLAAAAALAALVVGVIGVTRAGSSARIRADEGSARHKELHPLHTAPADNEENLAAPALTGAEAAAAPIARRTTPILPPAALIPTTIVTSPSATGSPAPSSSSSPARNLMDRRR